MKIEILPLQGKYYGTKIKIAHEGNLSGEITIWGAAPKRYKPSVREIALSPDVPVEELMCDCHYEEQGDYEIALVIEKALKEHFAK